MKQAYALLLSFILLSNIASATNKFWVGPLNGAWSNSANWSLVSGGAGGAGTPGNTDDINFNGVARIIVDTNTVVHSIYTNFITGKVLLIANINSSIIITGALNIGFGGYIKDSTTANVAFDVTFIKGASASIQGDWIFEGGTPVTGNNGASFTAPLGTLVHVTKSPIGSAGGRIICNKNSKSISSSNATLNFDYSSYFISDNILNATIPYATWAKDSVSAMSPSGGTLGAPASTILLSGNLLSIHHPTGSLVYGRMVINLSALTSDVSLSLPDGCKVRGNLEIQNTNNHNLTLLSPVSATPNVTVEIGTTEAGKLFGGNLMVDGNSRVAMAHAAAKAPANNFKLLVNKSFKQSGGNFSLQDYDGATGMSTLDIKDDLIETGGTFITNSTTTGSSAKFRVIMDDPTYNAGPSGAFASSRIISMSSGTIDNGRKMVILRIDHSVYNIPLYTSFENGVILQSPLTVGKLELVRSPLTTTITNVLTVLDPAANSITIGSNNSYVNGPVRRATNSTGNYCFPTGKGNTAASGYVFDSCVVTPVTADASMYQSEYFNTASGLIATAIPLQGVSSNKYWSISRLSGANATITLVMHGAVTGSSALKGIVVANYISPCWMKVNGNILTPGNAITGSVTSRVMQAFGLFTFGYGVPRTLVNMNLMNDLSAASEKSSQVTSAKTMQDEMQVPAIYPNPFIDNFTMDFYNAGNATSNAMMSMYDLNGSLVYSQKLGNLVMGRNTVKINLSGKNIPAANYVARLNVDGAVANTVKLLKVR